MRRRALLIGLTAQMALAQFAMDRTAWAQKALEEAARPPEVSAIASFSVLGDMVRCIGGGLANVTSLVPADADVHAWQPTSADSRALASAGLLVENGLGLEGWMGRLSAASGFRGIRIVASSGVTPRMMRKGAVTSIDPHAWQNPRNGVIYARDIAEGLTAADPMHADAYRTGAAAYVARIEQTDDWIAGQFAPIPKAARRIVTTHDAFGYYGDRYGIEFLAAEGLATDAEPSAKAIAALVAQIKRERVRTVFLENMTDPRLTAMLARETGATVSGPLYSDALSKPDGPAPDYLAMLRYNTDMFVRAMRPA